MSPKISESQKKQKKQIIAEKSLETFKKLGYHETTMSKIAQSNDISKGGLYAYFENKEDIFIYILNYLLDRKTTLLECTRNKENAFNQLLEQWHRIILSWHDLDPKSTLLIFEFWLEASRNTEYRKKLISNYHLTEQYFLKILRQGVDNEEFKAGINPELITQIFWTYIDGQVQFWLARNHQPDENELNQLFEQIKILLTGLCNENKE